MAVGAQHGEPGKKRPLAQRVLSDELLRQLIAAGQVDVLVGVPTLNNATTVGTVAGAVHRSFATDFLRVRTVLINCDGGSSDGTPEIVRGASLREDETLIAPGSLRTIHRISAPYHGLPGKAGALRTLLAAAELLQAKALALFDADVTSIEPGWVARLVRPILDEHAEFVAPVFPRHPLDGLLITQLVRPMMSAAYGQRIREPLASEFACSGRFASHCLAQDVWSGPLARYGIDLWLTAEAQSAGFRCAQATLGPRVLASSSVRPGIAEIFSQVAGSLFTCLQIHESFWPARGGSEPVQCFGPACDPSSVAPGMDTASMADAFRTGVRDLAPVLEQILKPATFAALKTSAREVAKAVRYPDALWVAMVYEAAAAHRRGTIHREHLTRALVPLYLGRAAAFIAENEARDPADAEQALEAVCREYERAKPSLVESWPLENGR